MLGKKRSFIALMALLAILPSAKAYAEDGAPLSIVPPTKAAEQNPAATPTILARAGEHEDYDRVVFDWPRKVPYKITRDGGRATILFSAAAKVQLKQTAVLTRGRHFAAHTNADGHLEVSFNLDPKSVIKDFYSENSIAIDIQGQPIKDEPAAEAPPAEEKPIAPPEEKPKVDAPPVTEKPEKPPVILKAPLANPITIAPTPAKPAPAPHDIKIPQPAADSQAKPQDKTPDTKAEAAPASAPAPVPTETVTPPASVAPPQPAVAAAPQITAKPAREIPNINVGTRPVPVASLDPHTPVRAAIWARAGYGYIVFDKKFSLSVQELSAGLPAPVVNLQPLDLPKASGFRFAIPDKVEVHALLEGTLWKLFLTKLQPDIPVSASLVAQPDFALGARYLLPLPDAPEPVRMMDPVVGDDLIVVPLTQTHVFSIFRRMADFEILPAAQGMVIKPLTDKVIVRSVTDGAEITADSGLHLSSSNDTGENQQSGAKSKVIAAGKSLFDFSGWHGKAGETFTQARQRLQQTIVDVPEHERDRARLELARFYFSRGYGMEALALLNYLAKDVPDLARHSDFLALSGASKILANHPDDGLKDLIDADLDDLPEIKLWEAVGNAEVGNWPTAEEKFASSANLLSGYPEPFYSRFFVLAIESALSVGNDHEAADWLNMLQTSQHGIRIDPAIDYLHGVLHARAGQAQAAAQAWKLAAGSNDHLYKVRAEMALIGLGVANLSLSPSQAADRLEALRYAWRGDDLEVDILHRLGQFYIKARNVKSGLAVLSQILQLYPHSPLINKIHDEMTQTFHDVFLGDIGKNLTPLESLAVYQQYRDTLMPTGDDGVVVMRNLAERLASIDLLDQACDLLEDVAKNRLKGEDKGKIVVRLAALRLIDHKPQAAIDALELSKGETLTTDLAQEHTLLRARALSQLNRSDDALAEIKDNASFPAKILRADINMSSKHWADAAKSLLDLVGPPPAAGEAFKPEQADWLLRSALALAMAGDQPGLDRLAIDYGAAMAGSPQNSAFHILVEPEKPGQLKDIASVQGRIADVDMFQGFLNTYRKPDATAAAEDKKVP